MHKKPRESPDIFRNYWYGRTCMCIAILFFCFTSALLDAEAHSERTAPITYPGRSRLAGYGRVPCPTLLWRESMVLQFSVQACTYTYGGALAGLLLKMVAHCLQCSLPAYRWITMPHPCTPQTLQLMVTACGSGARLHRHLVNSSWSTHLFGGRTWCSFCFLFLVV